MLIWTLICSILATVAGIIKIVGKHNERKIDRIRLKLLAGNMTDSEDEWMQKISCRWPYSKRNELARWRPRKKDIDDEDRKQLVRKIKDTPKLVGRMIAEAEKKNRTEYYPKASDFLSMKQAAAGLRDDIQKSKSCLDEECKGARDDIFI